MSETRWWSTEWGRLLPGDIVQAPDDSEWAVRTIISREFEICALAGDRMAWSHHAPEEKVTARRPPLVGTGDRRDLQVEHWLRLAGLDVDVIEETR